VFRRHVSCGGQATAILGGSTSQNLTSKQVVTGLLESGVDVHLINRKRILHAKCYGSETTDGNRLIVSSGNFTGPGMSQNIEASVYLDTKTTSSMPFRWTDTLDSIFSQSWQFQKPNLKNLSSPAWKLLYDESVRSVTLDETEDATLLVVLSHADTVRIQAKRGSVEALGSQYIFLSKDCYDFFPPLTIPNSRGTKRSYSCIVKVSYPQLGYIDDNCRVTFEAENNLDFRFGTGPLRHTKIAAKGDIAAITRTGFKEYEVRFFSPLSKEFSKLTPFAVNFIGNRNKMYGTLSNADFYHISETTI
jgi:hypothetical protein